MKTILSYIRPKVPIMSVQLFIKFLGTVLELLLPWMLSTILDDFVPAGETSKIYLWGIMMIVCAALALASNVIANKMATSISKDITLRLRQDLFTKVTQLSASQEDFFTTPSLISRLTTDTYNVHQMIDRMQRLGIRAPILLLGGITITMFLEPVLTMVLVATLPLLACVVWFVSHYGIQLYTQAQAALDQLIRKAQESMTGIRVIQALSKVDYERNQFDTANRQVVVRERRASLLMNITNPVMNLLLNTGLTFVVIVGAFRVNQGITEPGTIIAFLSYFTIILNALMMVSRLFVMYSKGAASGRRIAQVLTAPAEMLQEKQLACDLTANPHIEFDHVSFSYTKVQETVSDIHFSLNQGETLGIIGPTGSGKSTILSLLLRFYDPDQGTIKINGQNLKAYSPDQLHQKFGVVFQNDFLYNDSIGENIRFGRPISQEEIEFASRIAQAGFIWEREDGFASEVASRGSNLSGGQKQRVLLARAMAGHPEILLLDDSSSALDYKTDADLRRALGTHFAHTTKIIISQRVSSIQNADKILVLENGSMVGYGTHDQLMDSCKSYQEIAEIQMGAVE